DLSVTTAFPWELRKTTAAKPKRQVDREHSDGHSGETSPTTDCGVFTSSSAEDGETGRGAELKTACGREGDICTGDKLPSHDGGDGGEGDKTDDEEDKVEDDNSALLQDHGGFERSDGVMFLKFTEKFNESAQLTAWPGALCSTLRLTMGPVASAMSNRFSARASCMLGAFIFAAGVIISGFAPNVPFLFLSYGLLQGRGLVYAPGLIIVGMYVNRYRGLGVGLSTAGVGAGTFLLPPVVELLFEEFGFQGAFLILGGVALNVCVVAAIYRPLSLHRSIVIGQRLKSTREDEEAMILTTKNLNDAKWTNNEDHIDIIDDAVHTNTNTPTPNNFKTSQTTAYPRKKSQTVCLKSAFQTCFPVEGDRKGSSKRKLIEWSLLKIPPFLFFCFSICLFTAAFKSAFTFLPALAKSKGLSQIQAAYLLSISGISDTVARILAGAILDFEKVRPFRPIAYNGVIFVITVLSFLSPFMTNFVEFAFLFGLYGALTGMYVSQKSVILVDILGQEKLSSSFGLMICFQGLGTFIGPPLAGLLKDIFGQYDEAFFLGGAAMAAAGGLMIVSNVYRVASERRRLARLERDKAQA
ncbi:hypothetical protein BaRGS_00035751, partial [Batillaria attramentaria]